MGIFEELQKELKLFLEKEGVSRYSFSKKIGVPESTLKRFLESSIKNPSSTLLDKIAKGMDGKIIFKNNNN